MTVRSYPSQQNLPTRRRLHTPFNVINYKIQRPQVHPVEGGHNPQLDNTRMNNQDIELPFETHIQHTIILTYDL